MDLTGLLTINNKDAYTEYNVFLAELEESGHENFDALIAVPDAKSQTVVNFKEHNGEDLPNQLKSEFDAIDRTLQFCIIGNDLNSLSTKLQSFINAIKSGWLIITVKDLRTYNMIYKSFGNLRIYNDTNVAACIFKVKFREPKYME